MATTAMVFVGAFGVGLGPCAKTTRVDAQRDASAAASASAAAAMSAAAAAASVAASAAASARAAQVAAASALAVSKAKDNLADIKWMIAHNVTSNPSRSGEGDLVSKCDAIDSARTALPKDRAPDPDLTSVLDEESALCSYDVPLVTASEALDHLNNATSQASKLLMCNIATKECDRARLVKPKDVKLRRMDARRITACGR